MPRIPRYKQQVLPSTKTGGAPLSTSIADTGQEAVSQGIGSLGNSLFQLGNEWQAQRDRTELISRQSDATLRLGQAELDAQAAPDSQTAMKIMDDALGEVGSYKLSGRVQRRYQDWLNGIGSNYTLKKTVIGMNKDAAKGRAIDMQAELLMSRDVDTPQEIDDVVDKIKTMYEQGRAVGNWRGRDAEYEGHVLGIRDRVERQLKENQKAQAEAADNQASSEAFEILKNGGTLKEALDVGPKYIQPKDLVTWETKIKTHQSLLIVNNQKDYDNAVGQAATDFTKKIQDESLTPEYVWNAQISVPPDKEADLAAFRDKWAGISEGIIDRQLKEQTAKTKKQIEDAHNPKLAGELASQAKQAETQKTRDAVKLSAAEAYASNQISQSEYQSIVGNADATFDTVYDKVKNQLGSDFRSTLLSKYNPKGITEWVVAQAKLKGMKNEPFDIQELINLYESHAQAREWLANNFDNYVDNEMARRNIEDPTLSDLREAAISLQKQYLNMKDEAVIELYKTWLTQ